MSKRVWKPGTVIYPLPAIMVSMGDYNDPTTHNIITIGWTGIINTNPPKTYVSIRPERYSYNIIKNSGEFVINLTNEDLVFATDYCGVKSGKKTNKFNDCNITPIKSEVVKAPSIKESPINIECKVFDIIELGSHHMFMADIVSVSTDEKYYDANDKFNFNDSNPICYSHGQYYTIGEPLGKFGFSVKKPK